MFAAQERQAPPDRPAGLPPCQFAANAEPRALRPRRKRLAFLAVAVALALSTPLLRAGTQGDEPASQPTSRKTSIKGPFSVAKNGARLAVLIVVDQLSTDVLRSGWAALGDDGIKRIERDGSSYPLATYEHASTLTGPGHATISTGASPIRHGITANDWFEPESRRYVNCCEDTNVRTFGAESRPAGSSAARLMAPTFGNALKAAFGARAKVVAVSVKDRSAIFLSGVGADLAVWIDLINGRFTTSTAFAATEPPFVQELNATAGAARYSNWVWERVGPKSLYAELDDNNAVERSLGGSRKFPHRLPDATLVDPKIMIEAIVTSPAGNEMVMSAARKALAELNLGRDDVPDLFAVSFSSNDLVGHACGPASQEVRDMLIRVDRHIAELLKTLDELVGPDRYVVELSSDHGVGLAPEFAAQQGLPAGRVRIEKLRAAIDDSLTKAFGSPAPNKWLAALDGTDVFLDKSTLEPRNISVDAAADVAAAAASTVSGMYAAFPWHRVEAGASTDPMLRAIRLARWTPRRPDVYLVPKPHHLIGTSTVASHGTPYAYDRRVPLMLMGPGIRRGYSSPIVAGPGSGVVTLAEALGITPPAACDHPVLGDALAR